MWHQVSLSTHHSSTTHLVSSRCCTALTTSPPERTRLSIPKVIHHWLLYKLFCDLILYFAERVVKNTYSRNDTTTFAKSYWWLNPASFPDKSLLFSSGEGNYISQNVLSRIHIHGTTLRLLLSLLVVEHSKFFPDKSLLFSSGEGNIQSVLI